MPSLSHIFAEQASDIIFILRKRLLPLCEQLMIYYEPMKKKTVNQTFKRVAVAVGISGAAERDYLSGIFRYVNTGKRWSLDLLKTQEELERHIQTNGNPDGIILALPNKTQLWGMLLKNIAPTVFVDIPPQGKMPKSKPFSFVRLDDLGIGSAAAEHLLSRGRFNSFLCVIDQPQFQYPAHRRQGFCNRLNGINAPVETLVISEAAADCEETEMIRQTLSRLPRPAAIFVVRDRAALKIYDVCRRFRISIPEEVAILGVDNDELFCKTLPVRLSSILPNHEQIGFMAARELNRLMHYGDGREIVYPKSVKEIVVRDSTRIIPPAARLISSAISYIDDNVTRPLHVDDIVHHIGVSRRLAELRFRKIQGESILDAITRSRIKALKERLKHSQKSIAQLAVEFGFSSSSSLVRYFKANVGETPSVWRHGKS